MFNQARATISGRVLKDIQKMPHPTFAGLSDVMEETREEAERRILRAHLVSALKRYLERTDLSQSEVAKLFGVSQALVSDLKRGKVNLFGLDALVTMAAAAGLHV